MSPRWRTTWITALAVLLLLLVAALVIWFLRTHERVNEQLPLPAYGEAAYNPLYALRQALRTDGLSAESRRRLDLDAMQLQPGDSVLLLDDPRLLGARERQRLLDWTASGGHLLLRVVAAEGEDDHGDADALLTTLGVQLSDEAPRCQFWQVSGDGEHSEFCNGPRFTLDAAADPELQWPVGSNDGLGYARLRYGQGRVDVLSDMDFLLNRGDELRGAGLRRLLANDHSGGLRDIAHRDLARQVLAPNYGQGTVHLVYSAQLPSFWLGVLRQAWPLWLPLLLALLAWLWMRSQRFGALLPSPREERRSLLEHVQASGQYLFRYGHSPLLYDAVHASFLARLRRRAPMAAALDDDARVQAIADHLQWPLTRVQQALQAPAGNDRAGLRDRIRLLIQMRNQL